VAYGCLRVDVSGIQLCLLYSNIVVSGKTVECMLLLGRSLTVSCLKGDGERERSNLILLKGQNSANHIPSKCCILLLRKGAEVFFNSSKDTSVAILQFICS